MPTQDEVIAKHLQDSLARGELQTAAGFGKPMVEDEGWEATPDSLRMPFKILKRAGFVPPEVEMFQRRAALNAQVAAASSKAERDALMRELSNLEQSISLRLEAMRTRG
jgi:Domain of unknown function (DUF1992)